MENIEDYKEINRNISNYIKEVSELQDRTSELDQRLLRQLNYDIDEKMKGLKSLRDEIKSEVDKLGKYDHGNLATQVIQKLNLSILKKAENERIEEMKQIIESKVQEHLYTKPYKKLLELTVIFNVAVFIAMGSIFIYSAKNDQQIKYDLKWKTKYDQVVEQARNMVIERDKEIKQLKGQR